MSYMLDIKAFFFNAKTDYLPYYKQFKLNLPYDSTAKDILEAIKEQNENFSYPGRKPVFRINNLIVEGDTSLADIVVKLGTELQIDSANNYRSNDGLVINDDDFMQSYSLLEPYADASDAEYYKSLYALHYASQTEEFDHRYIGDAILVLAYKMISKGSIHKEAILEAVTSADSGLFACEYENNLFYPQDHTHKIEALKKMAKEDEDQHPSFFDLIQFRFGNKKEKKETKSLTLSKPRVEPDIPFLGDKHIAYYAGKRMDNQDSISKAICAIGAKEVNFLRKYNLSGASIIKDDKTLALKKAGAILLDAYDSGAEVLIVEDEFSYDMFKRHFKEIENSVGRKIIKLQLITAKSFILQSQAIQTA